MGDWAAGGPAELSLEEKIGQLIWTGVGDRRLLVEEMIRAGKVGAVILGPTDLPGPERSARFTNQLQEQSPIPLLVASDGEHGMGQFVVGATDLPTNMAIGATGSEDLAYAAGRVNAIESAAMGIHFPAPVVCDVNTNPDNPIINVRSFGDDPEAVSRLSVAVMRGLQDNGIAGSAWHFPGHGDTRQDSHRELPVVAHGRERLWSVELPPFKALIDAGVLIIGTAHICYPALDAAPGRPATLSRAIMTGLLRSELGFGGVVVSDSMRMWAIANNFGRAESVPMALEAGVDLVLADDPAETYEVLLAAAMSGRVSARRLDEAVGRVLWLKRWLRLHRSRLVEPEAVGQRVGTAEHARVALDIARAAITRVRGEQPGEALATDARVALVTTPCRRSTGVRANDELAAMFREWHPRGTLVRMSDAPEDWEVEAVAQQVQGVERAIFATFARPVAYREDSTLVPAGHAEVVRRLAATMPTTVVAFGSPYALRHFGQAQTLLCAYGDCNASLRAGLEAATGRLRPEGKLPVRLPGVS